jgi:hypothetical protein
MRALVAMLQTQNVRIKDKEKLHAFQVELIQLYRKFEADVETLCKKRGLTINCWYSPSTIPQPKFILNGVGFDADELYNGIEVTTPLHERKKVMKRTKGEQRL